MSDEENTPEEVEASEDVEVVSREEEKEESVVDEPVEEVTLVEKQETHPPKPSFIPPRDDDDENACEAKVRMEMELKKRKEKVEDDWAEYEAMRKIERERAAEEILQLRQRREKRRQERAEEEKRLAELRAVEEQRRRAEEEERQRKRREEEQHKKEDRERKRKEAEDRHRLIGKPNFTISKREGGVDESATEENRKAPQKTKEQLEAEKKAALEQRRLPLNISGCNAEQLREKAKELHQHIYRLESEKYDLKQRFERQNYDMMELSERARQMNKGGGGKNPKVNVMQTPDPLASKISGIPQKVQMYSQYERVKDRRSFVERRDVFKGPLYADEYLRIAPENKVIMTDEGARIVGRANDNVENVPPQAEQAGEE